MGSIYNWLIAFDSKRRSKKWIRVKRTKWARTTADDVNIELAIGITMGAASRIKLEPRPREQASKCLLMFDNENTAMILLFHSAYHGVFGSKERV